MISRKELVDVAAEAMHNPRAGRYLVRPLGGARPYPFKQGDGAIPGVVTQFAVEHPDDENAHRVISIGVTHAGYSVWCGDKFTQGDIMPLEASLRVGMALAAIPEAYQDGARRAMMAGYGAYPHRAPCHFWQAWHSHRGVCKHVAAALQYVEQAMPNGLEGVLLVMESMLYSLTTAPLLELLAQAEATQADVLDDEPAPEAETAPVSKGPEGPASAVPRPGSLLATASLAGVSLALMGGTWAVGKLRSVKPNGNRAK